MSKGLCTTMELEGNLPGSLVEATNDPAEGQLFDDWSFGEGKAVFPGLAAPDLRYSEQLVAYTPSDGVRAMNDAISSYVDQHPFGLEPASCSWDKVFSEMDNAKQEYEGKGKIEALRLRLRLRLRHGNGVQRNLTPVLDCIPTDNGLGILKAGLAVIFNAVKRRSDACERIFQCFSSVPSLLEKAQDLESIHKNEPKLGRRLQALHEALFQSIPALIDILLRQEKDGQGRPANGQTMFSKMKKTIVARRDDIFGDPVNKVDSLVEPINKAVADLDECVRLLDSRNIQEVVGDMTEIKTSFHQLKEDMKQDRMELTRERETTERNNRRIIAQEHEAAERHREWMAEIAMLATGFRRFLAEGKRRASIDGSYTSGSASSPRRTGPPRSLAAPVVHNVGLVDLIDAIASHRAHRLPVQHMRALVGKGGEFEEAALGRAYYLLGMPAFRRWISHASPPPFSSRATPPPTSVGPCRRCRCFAPRSPPASTTRAAACSSSPAGWPGTTRSSAGRSGSPGACWASS
ncbi:hypothetical protein RB596_002070 [Gaeumannomyces avenae]